MCNTPVWTDTVFTEMELCSCCEIAPLTEPGPGFCPACWEAARADTATERAVPTECEECGEPGELELVDGCYCCQDCRSEEPQECDECGEQADDLELIDGFHYCRNCQTEEDEQPECDECGEPSTSLVLIEGFHYCLECRQ